MKHFQNLSASINHVESCTSPRIHASVRFSIYTYTDIVFNNNNKNKGRKERKKITHKLLIEFYIYNTLHFNLFLTISRQSFCSRWLLYNIKQNSIFYSHSYYYTLIHTLHFYTGMRCVDGTRISKTCYAFFVVLCVYVLNCVAFYIKILLDMAGWLGRS